MNQGKMQQRHNKSYVLSILIYAMCLCTSALADCNENQAFNKMMAFNEAWGEYQRNYMSSTQVYQRDNFEKFSSGAQRSAAISAKLKDKKWSEVCRDYDELALEYKFNLAKSSKGMITIEELKADGGRRGGICSLEEASKKLVSVQKKFYDRYSNGEIKLEVQKAFQKESDNISPMLTKDPSAACTATSALAKKYGIN